MFHQFASLGSLEIKGLIREFRKSEYQIRLKGSINESGIFSIESVHILQPSIIEKGINDNMMELKIEWKPAGNIQELFEKYSRVESQLLATDKLIVQALEKKNTLEAYIYEMRNKIKGSHREFTSESDKMTFLEQLSKTQDWLNEQGDTANESIFAHQLTLLQKYGDPIDTRYKDFEERPNAIANLQKTINDTTFFGSISSSTD